MVDYKSLDTIYGGDFVGKLRKFGNNVYKGLSKALPFVKDVASVASAVAPFVPYALPLLGLGDDQYDGGVMVGGRRKGGKAISRSELHRRMLN
jgi:hypothetical protein